GDFARQLKGAVSALRRQRPAAVSTPAYKRAYRDGLTNVRLTYGPRLARRVAQQLRDPQGRSKALWDLIVLVRFYPGAPWHAARRAPAMLTNRAQSDRSAAPDRW